MPDSPATLPSTTSSAPTNLRTDFKFDVELTEQVIPLEKITADKMELIKKYAPFCLFTDVSGSVAGTKTNLLLTTVLLLGIGKNSISTYNALRIFNREAYDKVDKNNFAMAVNLVLHVLKSFDDLEQIFDQTIKLLILLADKKILTDDLLNLKIIIPSEDNRETTLRYELHLIGNKLGKCNQLLLNVSLSILESAPEKQVIKELEAAINSFDKDDVDCQIITFGGFLKDRNALHLLSKCKNLNDSGQKFVAHFEEDLRSIDCKQAVAAKCLTPSVSKTPPSPSPPPGVSAMDAKALTPSQSDKGIASNCKKPLHHSISAKAMAKSTKRDQIVTTDFFSITLNGSHKGKLDMLSSSVVERSKPKPIRQMTRGRFGFHAPSSLDVEAMNKSNGKSPFAGAKRNLKKLHATIDASHPRCRYTRG